MIKDSRETKYDLKPEKSNKDTKEKELDDYPFQESTKEPVDSVNLEPKYEFVRETSDKDDPANEIGDPLYWKPSAQDASSVGTAQTEPKYYTIPDNGSEATQSDGKLYHWYHG